MKRTNSQNARFHQLVGQRKLDQDEKKQLVLNFTNGRTDSSAEMTSAEMTAAIHQLEGLSSTEQASIRKMRAKIVAIAKDIFGVHDMDQASWDNLNTFLLSKFEGRLDELDGEQLRKAVTGIQAWQKHEIKKRAEAAAVQHPPMPTGYRKGPTIKPVIQPRWLAIPDDETYSQFLSRWQEYRLQADYLERKIANEQSRNQVDITDVLSLRDAQAQIIVCAQYYALQPINREN